MKSTKQNCWEYMQCGLESEGKNAEHLGVCPAATDTSHDGRNGGKNAGRYCWKVDGTRCKEQNYKSKLIKCIECEFFKRVQDELSSVFVI